VEPIYPRPAGRIPEAAPLRRRVASVVRVVGSVSLKSLSRACALAVLAAALLGASPAAAAGPVDVTAAHAGGVRSYWSPERMRAAEPLATIDGDTLAGAGTGEPAAASPGPPVVVDPVPAGSAAVPRLERGLAGASAKRGGGYTRSEVADPSGESVRMHGKVFLTIKGGTVPGDYVCSGTALSSNNGSVVWSAGHCIFDTDGGGYATNWMFVPAYENGFAPYGEWPAVKLASPDAWRKHANSSYDFSAAEVATNGAGQTLNAVVGGRGIGFNQPRTQHYSSFGYPAQQPPLEFTGGREFRCDAGLGGTDNPPGSGPNTNWIGCDMTGGSSGGGWVADGTLLGLNSYSYCVVLVCEERLYGPYFDDTAKKLYKEIAGDTSYCQDKRVTILGTDGADELEGTGGKDVIKAKGGKDDVDGKGGKDTVCGGGGNDKLRGGGGKDSCNGGGGRDSAKSCESEKKIP
jgi:V8-like Glu-specific endopeptidase